MRASTLSPAETFILRQWGRTLFESFGAMPYLVGSVARAEPYRDVDVRVMLDDSDPLLREPRLTALNVALSVWGQRVTGLPIDCQFQAISVGNAPETDGPRHPIGFIPPGEAAF